MRTIIPSELDILPPRPVLFPWLPSSMDCFLDLGLGSCCFGAEQIAPTTKDQQPQHEPPAIQSVFSFDEDDDNEKFCDAVGTPATQPLSPASSTDSRNYRHNLKPLFGHEKAAGGHGTTNILVLTREEEEEIPDMSDVLSEAGSDGSNDEDDVVQDYHKPKKNFFSPKVKLVSLTDVLEQVLRVLMFFMSANSLKPKMLWSGNQQPQKVRS